MKNYELTELVEVDLEGFLDADPEAEETIYPLNEEEVPDGGTE